MKRPPIAPLAAIAAMPCAIGLYQYFDGPETSTKEQITILSEPQKQEPTPIKTQRPQELSDIIDELDDPSDFIIQCPSGTDHSIWLSSNPNLDLNNLTPENTAGEWFVFIKPSTLSIQGDQASTAIKSSGYTYFSLNEGKIGHIVHTMAPKHQTCPPDAPHLHFLSNQAGLVGDLPPQASKNICLPEDIDELMMKFPYGNTFQAAAAACDRAAE